MVQGVPHKSANLHKNKQKYNWLKHDFYFRCWFFESGVLLGNMGHLQAWCWELCLKRYTSGVVYACNLFIYRSQWKVVGYSSYRSRGLYLCKSQLPKQNIAYGYIRFKWKQYFRKWLNPSTNVFIRLTTYFW